MVYALLLLGLVPLAFLPDIFSGGDEDTEDETEPQNIDPNDDGGLLSGIDLGTTDDVLPPLIEDDDPSADADRDGEILDPLIEDDTSGADTVLPPVIEDDIAGDSTGTDPEDVLSPVIEEDTAGDSTGTDPSGVLPPVIEDDIAKGDGDVLLPVAEDDPAPVGAFSAPIEVTQTTPAEITGFDATEDILCVTINPDFMDGPLNVVTPPSADGEHTLVYVDEMLIATLNASAKLDASHIYIDNGALPF